MNKIWELVATWQPFFIFTEDVGTHTPYLESGRHSATDLLDATRGLFCKVLLLRHAALYKQNSSTFIIALLSLLLWSQILLELESFICSNFLVEQILLSKFCCSNFVVQILLSISCFLWWVSSTPFSIPFRLPVQL